MNNPDWMEAPLDEGRAEVVTDGRYAPDSLVPMVSRSVRLPVDLYEWLKQETIARGLPSWSELVRVLIEEARRPADEPVVPVRELEALIASHRNAA
jgi:Arc/MetJ-type ribon-helix-helix transcriptional regulator